MSAPDKLALYNLALLAVGERALSSLTEQREARRHLDTVWAGNAVNACLEEGQWNFASRSQRLDFTSNIAPAFGYRRAFTKPSDWVRTMAVAIDEFFRSPLNSYLDESGYWYADLDQIYVRFVSDDPSYGLNYSRWPASFQDVVTGYLAWKIGPKITTSRDRVVELEKEYLKALKDARTKDAMNGPVGIPARGSWSTARQGNRASWDRGYKTGDLV